MRKLFSIHKRFLAAGLTGALILVLAAVGLWALGQPASANPDVTLKHVNPDGTDYLGNPFCPDTIWVAGVPIINPNHDCNNITSQNHLIRTSGFNAATMSAVQFNIAGVGEIVGPAGGTRCGDLYEVYLRPGWNTANNGERCLVIHSSDPGETRVTFTWTEPAPTPTPYVTPSFTPIPTATPTPRPPVTRTTNAVVKEWDSLLDTVILKKGDLESVTVAGLGTIYLPKDVNGDGNRDQVDEHLLDKKNGWQDHPVLMDEALKRLRSASGPVQLIEVVHGEHDVLIDSTTITVHQPTEGAIILATIQGNCTYFTDSTGTQNFGQQMNGVSTYDGRFIGPHLAPAVTMPADLSLAPFTHMGPYPNGSPPISDQFRDTNDNGVRDPGEGEWDFNDIYVDTVCEEQAEIVIQTGYPDIPGSLPLVPPDEWIGINWTTIEMAKQPQIRWAGEEIVLAKRWALPGDWFPNIDTTTSLTEVPCPLVTAYDYDGDGDTDWDDFLALGLISLDGTTILDHYVQYSRLDPSPGGLVGGYQDWDDDGTNETLDPDEPDHAIAEVDSSCVSKALYASDDPGEADIEGILIEERDYCPTGWVPDAPNPGGYRSYSCGSGSTYSESLINNHAFLVWYLKIFQVKLTNVDGSRDNHNAGPWSPEPIDSSTDSEADTLNVSADTLLRVKVKGWLYTENRSARPDTCIDVDGDGDATDDDGDTLLNEDPNDGVDNDGDTKIDEDSQVPGEPYQAVTYAGCPDPDDEMLSGGFWVLPDDLPVLAGPEPIETRTSWDVMQGPDGATLDSSGLVGPKSSLDSHDAVGRPWIPCLPGTCPRKTVAPDGAVDVSDALMPLLKIRASILDPNDSVDNDADTVIDEDAGFLKEANKKVDVYTSGSNLYYRIMVPADPEIPPFVSNGGYGWDSWYSRIEDGNVKSPLDTDNDGVPDAVDNCPTVANPNQYDLDFEGMGDACDGDIDGDGAENASDPCQYDPIISGPGATDTDSDGTPDSCDLNPADATAKDQDADRDGVADSADNCPTRSNPDQTDTDKDGAGDVCDDTVSSGGPFTKVIAPLYVDPNPTGLAQGPYEFWHILNKLTIQEQGKEYPYNIEFYTDNRGEGMFFANGDYNLSFDGCPLQQLSGAPDCKPGRVVGTTTIQVIGDYPYFRKHTTVQSNPVEKTWTWGGFKSVTAERIDNNHTVIIAHLKDRDGYCKWSVGANPTVASSVVFSPSENEVQHEWIEFLLNDAVGYIREVSPNALYVGTSLAGLPVQDTHSVIDLNMPLDQVVQIKDHLHSPLAKMRSTATSAADLEAGRTFPAERAALARAEDVRVLNYYGWGRSVDTRYVDPANPDECQAWVLIEHPADQTPSVSIVFHDPEGNIDRHWPPSQFVSVLVPGWNDSCYTGPEMDIEEALTDAGLIEEDGTSHVLAVYRFTNDENQAFDRWFPGRPDIEDTLTTISPFDQLFLLLDSPMSWTMEMTMPPTSAELQQGWNSVCYAGESLPTEQAVADWGDFVILRSLASDQTWRRYVPGQPELTNIVTLNQFTSVSVLVGAVAQPGGPMASASDDVAVAEYCAPLFPGAYYGTVTINGLPAPDGTVVHASIGGIEWANAFASGGRYVADVPQAMPVSPPCFAGGQMTFAVDGLTCQESPTWSSGLDVLDLHCGEIATLVRIGSGQAPPGGQVTLPLDALDVPPVGLGAFTVDIAYEAGVVTPTGYVGDPDSRFDSVLCNLNYGPSTVRCTGIRATSDAVGDLMLAEITFEVEPDAPLSHQSSLALTVVTFADTEGYDIPHATEDGSIRVGLVGDVDCDQDVDAVDALFILQYVVGLRSAGNQCPLAAGTLYLPAADAQCDNDADAVDAMFVLQHVVGLRPSLECQAPLDISGPWLMYMTPEGGAESEPDCSFIHQESWGVYYSDWRRVYGVSVQGTITDHALELSGQGTYYGDAINFSASATANGNTITGTYAYTGAYSENGTWRAERAECKKAKGWVRTFNIQNQGYGLNFDVWDLIPEGITFTSAEVTGPLIGTMSLCSGGPTEYHPWSRCEAGPFPVQTVPTPGDVYTFTVHYSDGTSETVTAAVRETFVGFPTPISPSDGEVIGTTAPTFTWQPPACECQGYYRVWVVDSQGNDMWSVYPPKEATSVTYNFDGTGMPLVDGGTYEWRLIAFDEPTSGGPDNNAMVLRSFTVEIGAP